MVQLAIGVLWAVSSGLGFDPGAGMEARLDGRYFELSASATTERKHHAWSGYTWAGEALLALPVGDLRLLGGVSAYGYETDGWQKSDSVPVAALAYHGDTVRARLSHSFEDDYGISATSLLVEYAMTPRWWVGASYGVVPDGSIADVRLTFRP